MSKSSWQYIGDVSIRHGGTYFLVNNSEIENGYMSAVRVTPCSDAGLPDNQFWVEWLTINFLDDAEKVARALECCGYDKKPDDIILIAYALMQYGDYDIECCKIIQIGGPDEFYSGNGLPLIPDYKLRHGSSLRNWVKKHLNDN